MTQVVKERPLTTQETPCEPTPTPTPTPEPEKWP